MECCCLNVVTRQYIYPVFRIDEYFELLTKIKTLLILDAISDNWQIDMDSKNILNTTYISQLGLSDLKNTFCVIDAAATLQLATGVLLVLLK